MVIKNTACSRCCGVLKLIDEANQSITAQCQKCCRVMLLLAEPRFAPIAIPLRDAHLRRGTGANRRNWKEMSMAENLVKDLALNWWPTPGRVADFGVRTPAHFAALQNIVNRGVASYELDRVLGDGEAITKLVRHVSVQEGFSDIVFSTIWDELRNGKRSKLSVVSVRLP